MSEGEFIERLFAADAAYQDDLDYDLFPGAFSGQGYNSKSYVEGLIKAAQGRSPAFGHTYGGWDPVPPGSFRP